MLGNCGEITTDISVFGISGGILKMELPKWYSGKVHNYGRHMQMHMQGLETWISFWYACVIVARCSPLSVYVSGRI